MDLDEAAVPGLKALLHVLQGGAGLEAQVLVVVHGQQIAEPLSDKLVHGVDGGFLYRQRFLAERTHAVGQLIAEIGHHLGPQMTHLKHQVQCPHGLRVGR